MTEEFQPFSESESIRRTAEIWMRTVDEVQEKLAEERQLKRMLAAPVLSAVDATFQPPSRWLIWLDRSGPFVRLLSACALVAIAVRLWLG